MLKSALRNLIAHKLRLILTLLAIALGVSFVVGTFVFTDSLNKSLAQLFDTEPADVVVQPNDATGGQSGRGAGQAPGLTMPESVIAQVHDVAGVKSVIGSVDQVGAVVLNADDESVAGSNSTPIGVSWEPGQDSGQATLVSGAAPKSDGQLALDTSTAAKANAQVGSTIRLSTPLHTDATKKWEVTAVVDIGLSGGATVVLFDLETAQKYLVGKGEISKVLVTVDEGESPGEVAAAINSDFSKDSELGGTPAAGEEYEAITGAQAADQQEQQITDRLGFLNTFLLVFALVAVFVSTFLIFNTFSMLVAQRTREIALLRAVGATRHQIQAGVVTEAFVLSVVATAIGIGLGIGMAFGLRRLFEAFGIELPSGDLEIAPRTIVVAFAVGIVITVAAAWIPARRASSILPVAAMRDATSPPRAAITRRFWFGVASWALALLTAWLGLSNGSETGIAWIGVSTLVGVVGAIALLPFVAGPALTVLGLPFRGSVGKLAVQNSRRSPRRTAATGSALMIGVTLMTIMVIFASSFTATADQAIDDAYGADFTLGSPPTYQPFDADLYSKVKELGGIESSTHVRTTEGRKKTEAFPVYGVESDKITEMINFEMEEGSLTDIGEGKAAVDTDTAKQLGWSVGDDVPITLRTGQAEVEIAAVYKKILVYEGLVTDFNTAEKWGAPAGLDTVIYLKLAEGADAEQVRQSVERILEKHPTVTGLDQAQIKADIRSQINTLLGFVMALLGLAILIAVLGIVNTLLLSVAERTRELGLLRAVGALRSQVRLLILIESLLLGVFGAAAGVVLGVVFGVLIQRAMISQGLTALEIPWVTLVVFLVAGALAGVIASVWPAFSASRLNILSAIAAQ